MKKLGFIVILLVSLTVSTVYADTITLDINQGSTLPSISYGSLTLTLNVGEIDVVISMAPNYLIQTGQDASVAFNSSLNPDPSISITTALPTGYALISGSPGSLHMNGFGYFEYGISGPGPSPGSSKVQSLSFTIATPAGFTSVWDLLEYSTNGGETSQWAFDIITPTGATGIVGTEIRTPPSEIPEPTTLILLGSGLLAVGVLARRRK